MKKMGVGIIPIIRQTDTYALLQKLPVATFIGAYVSKDINLMD